MRNLDLQNSYKIYTSNYKKSDTVVIDNGTFELKAGYLGDKVALKFQNCFFKDAEGLKFQMTKTKNKYLPFTYDLISGFHVLEENIDQALEFLNVKDCKNLIITDAIYSPTKNDLIKFLFEVYHFEKIQVGVDGIYSYLHNITDRDKFQVIISLGHTATCVYVIKGNEILDVYKINYGGKFALTYLTNLLRYKFKEHNKEFTGLLKELRCAIDYDKEVFEIIEKMKRKDFVDSICISAPVEEKEVIVDIEKRNRLVERLKNINKKRKKVESESEEFDTESDEEIESEEIESEDELDEEEIEEELDDQLDDEKVEDQLDDEKVEINAEQVEDEEIVDEKEELDDSIVVVKEKKPMPGMYKMRVYQYNLRLTKIFKRFAKKINFEEEELEKLVDMPSFLNKKKSRYEQILRELELREKCRKDATNRKTYEFGLLLKTGELTEEEKEYKKKIKDCEDTKIDEKLIKEKDDLLEIINIYDSNYILSMSTILDLLTGKNLEKQLVNVDLLRVSEVLFEPSLLGSEQMGLGEILENILKNKEIKDIFITGGFSRIKGLKERIESECKKYSYNEVNVREAEDPVEDAFNGACFSEIFETYTFEDFESGKL